MVRIRIAGALVVVALTSCSVEEPEQSLRVAYRAEAKKETDDSQKTPVTTAQTSAAENAGLRADFNAP